MSPVRSAFLVLLIVCNGGNAKDRAVEQIYKGEISKEDQFKFVVRLYNLDSMIHPLCTGSVVKTNLVLTAGHCCVAVKRILVVTGKKDHEKFYKTALLTGDWNVPGYYAYKALKRYIHPGYQEKSFTVKHDVCLLLLERDMNSSVDGHEVAFVGTKPLNDKTCTAVGWGKTEDDELQHKLRYVNSKASAHYRGNWLIKLSRHSICSGDSGGPLVCDDGLVYGVASFSTGRKCYIPSKNFYANLKQESPFLTRFIDVSLTSKKIPDLPLLALLAAVHRLMF